MVLEQSFSFQDSIAILPELILVGCILLILLIDLTDTNKERKESIVYSVSLASLIIAVIPMITKWGQAPTIYFLGSVQIDSLGLIFRFFLLLCSTLCVTLSREYMKCSEIALSEFLIFILGATLGGMFLCEANDLITIFVSLELLSLSCYLLAGYTKKDIRSNEAAMKYLLIGGASSCILTYGFSWFYGISGGEIQLSKITQSIQINQLSYSLETWIAFICIIVGLGFKISIAPFHQWTPDVYEGSPTPVVAFLSVGSKAAGLALTMRFLNIIVPYWQEEWHLLVETLAILSMILGNFIALTQTSMKRILAYSSISQVGYLMIGIVAGNPDGYASIAVYMMLYIFMNLGAFACIIIFGLRTGTDQIRDYTGLYKKDPWLAFCFSIFLLSLGGIPPLAGFFGKLYLFWCGWKAGLYVLVWVGLLTSVISIYYYLKIVKIIMIKEEKETSFYVQNYVSSSFSIVPKTSIELSLFLCVLASSVLGIAMNPIIAIAQEAVSFNNLIVQ